LCGGKVAQVQGREKNKVASAHAGEGSGITDMSV
jgi:hypothetical protein